MADLKRRLPYYASDFRDGLQTKTIGSTLFLFFACLAPAITFGGLMGKATGQQIGVVEMLVGTAICGAIYALTATQPMIILGGVGPLLVFTKIVYDLCASAGGIEFLPAYAWVGFWTAGMLLLLAAFEASVLMRYFTRFTDEIFSALMAVIFIYEAVRAIVFVFRDSFSQDELGHDAAFLSLILAIGTFYIATNLSRFRRSKYLLPKVREFLADFGPTLALVAMAFVAWLLQEEVKLESLSAPSEFRTTSGRAWLVDILGGTSVGPLGGGRTGGGGRRAALLDAEHHRAVGE